MATLVLAGWMTLFSWAQDCTISPQAEAELLALPYQDFDQSMGAGWRAYADRGCYLLSARLLDRYRGLHADAMLDWQIRILIWHAGQMFAFDDNYGTARERFQASFDSQEPPDTPILWNDYVHATLAFLDKDLEKIRLHRARIASGPEFNGSRANLAVVDALIRCFGRPYSVAYSGCRE